MVTEHTLSQEQFDEIYSKVPRLTVEIIVRNKEKNSSLYLTKRDIEPCRGQWHLPGGTVRFGEPLTDAVIRIAKRELNINVINMKLVGYIEYPSHYKNGMDSPVGMAFEVTKYDGVLQANSESQNSGWFTEIPANFHADQDSFLLRNGYLKQPH